MARHTFSIILAILMLAVLCVSAAFAASKPAARLPFAAREAIRQAQAQIAAAKARYERRVRLIEIAERQKLKAAELAAMHAGNLRRAEAVNAAIATSVKPTKAKPKATDSPVGNWENLGTRLDFLPNHRVIMFNSTPVQGKWWKEGRNFVEIWPSGYCDLCTLAPSGRSYTDRGAKLYKTWVVTAIKK